MINADHQTIQYTLKRAALPSLGAPVSTLHGVGSRIKEKLERLGIHTVRDLLFHLPIRYIDRTKLTPIGALQPGVNALVDGTTELTQINFGRRRSLVCRISDGTGSVTLRFFYFSKSQQEQLQRGTNIRCFGQVRRGPHSLEMIHPEYQLTSANKTTPLDDRLTPVYPVTEGLHQARIRKLTDQALLALDRSDSSDMELLPVKILELFKLSDLKTALYFVHRPPPDTTTELLNGVHPAQQRLTFEELLSQYLGLQRLRQKLRSHRTTALNADDDVFTKFLQSLPFQLTDAQQRAVYEIQQDLDKSVPMLRLLQGDVGSGKTIVAALACLQTIHAGYQAAIMAPTELLAEQHFNTLNEWFKNLDIKIRLITGQAGKKARNQNLADLTDPSPCIAVGTHALFQKTIEFSRLRLIVIDEQHRFGVHQRLALFDKGKQGNNVSHQLIMTATPIPRTLAMTLYADLDLSVLDTMPPGRQAVNTAVIPTSRRDEIIERIRNVCAEKRQVYWVCTLIEESDVLQCETAIDTHQQLTEKLPEISIGLIHGRMKHNEKESVMADFKNGRIQLLVATTVIEVGVDVPNASLMIIENAERFGLFQLHQLRGRIGRGTIKSDCVLLYQTPLGETAKTRLDILRRTVNGFEVAQKDLELRGPGELMGTRQTGLPSLRIADLMRDARLLPDVHLAADLLVKDHPEYIQPLIDRWLGQQTEYVKV